MPKNTKEQRLRRESEGKHGHKVSYSDRRRKRTEEEVSSDSPPSAVKLTNHRQDGSNIHAPRKFNGYGLR